MVSVGDFGILPDGRPVQRITLCDGRLTAQVLTLGAIVQDLRLDGVDHSLVLGAQELEAYLGPARYFGAIVGRFANRIGGARFSLDGTEFHTDTNFRDRHTLHGGFDGTDAQIWQIASSESDRVSLHLFLADGHMGFPGRLNISAEIQLANLSLIFRLRAESDAPTPCSLAHHGYFNLDGSADIRGHSLRINADHYLPVDDDLIPTGEIAPVDDTAFDFRKARTVGDSGYDHNFCLSRERTALREVALLTGQAGLTMRVETTAPGLQFYDGAHFSGIAGTDGRVFGPKAGLALETQAWPDAPNRPEFPDATLRPGQIYLEETRYCFGRAD